jgi:predicted dehydrogenase
VAIFQQTTLIRKTHILMKRRNFLATSAFAGSWSLLSPLARAQGANGDLRVAVIGINSRGKALAGEVARCKGARLVALCDADTAVLDRVTAELGKGDRTITKFQDFRKLCEDKEIDAVVIATPNHTHALIAVTAAAHGKHVYVEKPVSHNVWEGRQLAKAAETYKVVIQHGFQRRSELGWAEALAAIEEGVIGKMTLARGLCYKPRNTIGKVVSAGKPPSTVDYDLWSGPREMAPVQRKQFHYDWHWQQPYGNGDLGNQGPHQLDVCRWAVGDPGLPVAVVSAGGRLGYDDDGDWANTQIAWFDYKPVPVLFEVRGLPAKNLDFKGGMDKFKGQDVGNVIECEGGWLSGGHNSTCRIHDSEGKVIREFSGGRSHMQNFVDAAKSGEIAAIRGVESGHLSSALAHLGNISWLLGSQMAADPGAAAMPDASAKDAFERMVTHLDANGVDLAKIPLTVGPMLSIDPTAERFTGDHAERANELLKGSYRSGFEIVV